LYFFVKLIVKQKEKIWIRVNLHIRMSQSITEKPKWIKKTKMSLQAIRTFAPRITKFRQHRKGKRKKKKKY